MEHVINAIGFTASLISFILFLPQAKLTWSVRKNPEALKGVSPGTLWLLLANASLWGAYAVITAQFWVGAPGIINAPLAIVQLFLIAKARKTEATTSNTGLNPELSPMPHILEEPLTPDLDFT